MRVLELSRQVRSRRPVARRGDDTGAVAVLVAILMSLFLVLTAFALDIGNAYANVRQLSVAADAAALSAAAKVGSLYPQGTACTAAGLTAINATSVAQAEADKKNTDNTKSGVSAPVEPVVVRCVGTDAIEVVVRNNRTVRTALAGIIGIDTMKPNSTATARYQRQPVGGGLRPWAVCATDVQASQANPNTTYWTALGNWSTKDTTGICGSSAPGQWGSVDFDGGGNGAPDLADWTLNGYPGQVVIPNSYLPADPGKTNSNGVRDALQSLVGQVNLFPSVTGISGSGNNAVFNAVGIATLKVCGIVYNGSIYNAGSDCWTTPTPSTTTSSTTVTPVVLTPSISAKGSIQNAKDVLTLSVSNLFSSLPTGPNISYTAVVTVNKAGGTNKTPADLVANASWTTTLPTNTLTLDKKASNTVAFPAGNLTNVTIVITQTTTTTTTTTTPGFGLYDDKGNLQDQIEYRWVNYTTSGYNGPGAGTCTFTNRNCVGTTVLWQ